MTVATEKDIEQLLRESLTERGVAEKVDHISLFSTPEGVLAEIVLKEADALDEADKAVRETERELADKGVSLLPTIRALWRIQQLDRVVLPAGAVPRELQDIPFCASLRSGSREQRVWVGVAPTALNLLTKQATGAAKPGVVKNAVEYFLRRHLSVGGPAHWDPTKSPALKLNEDDAWYLLYRPYERLKKAVDFAFRTHDRAREFLEAVRRANAPLRELRETVRYLPNLGTFLPGGKLPTNDELYPMLIPSESDELDRYYEDKLREVPKNYPDLADLAA